MFEKRAKFSFQHKEITALNKPKFGDNTFFVNQNVLMEKNAVQNTLKQITASHQASLDVDGDNTVFDLEAEIKDHPDSLFVKCFAIKADEMNDNGDYFSQIELNKATPTFVGVPVFTNHQNQDVNQARGKVVHSWWDADKNGIMIIARVDAEAYPQLARGIKEKYIAGCFPGDAPVLMSDGSEKSICDIEDGDYVISHTGKSRKVLGKRHRRYSYPLYKIKLEGIEQPLVCTAYHNMMVYKLSQECACGCETQLQDREDTRITASYFNRNFAHGHNARGINAEHNPIQKAKACELSIGDFLFEPKIVDDSCDDFVTEEEAFLIGLFIAEGSFEKRDGQRYSVAFNFDSKELETLAFKCEEALKSVFADYRNSPTVNYYPEASQSRVCLYGKEIAKWFYERCGEYSDSKKLHPNLLRLGDKKTSMLLAGYIEGDGYNVKGKTYGAATVSASLASQLRLLFQKIGIRDRFRHRDDKKRWGYKLVHEITCGLTTAEKLRDELIYKKADGAVYGAAEWHSLDDITLRKIVSIEEQDFDGEVYDIEVEEDHTYCVNHVAVSNTSMGCQVAYSICSACHNYAETPDSYCFAGNTPILMGDFTVRPIEDIKVGDRVIDKTGKPTTVTKLFRHHSNEKALLLKSRAIARELVCSKNHPFLVHSRGEYRYFPAEYLANNQVLYTPIPQIQRNNILFEKFKISDWANDDKLKLIRLIGYYAAEGCRVKRNGEIKAIDISLHKYEDVYADDIIDICETLFNKKPYDYIKKNTNGRTLRLWHRDAAQLICTICPGIVHRERSKRFDETIFSLSNEYVVQLMRGFVDGDGHCTENCEIVINSACPGLSSQLYYLFLTLNASPAINIYKNSGGPFARNKVFYCHRITLGNSQIKELANHGTKLTQAAVKETLQSKLTNVITEDGLYAKHTLIALDEIEFDGELFNFETESHSYIANNTAVHNCEHIRERKTRHISSKKQKCQYHKNGNEDQCPVCSSTEKDIKTFAYDGKAFEYNFGIKFIENSFVVSPACSSCGVEEVIDPSLFLAKVAHIQEVLPKLLKAASEQPLTCTDQSCIKIAGQQEIDLLNEALNQITSVSQAMLQQKDQIDLEFLSDLVSVLSDLQTVTDELIQQGYGRLESPAGAANLGTEQGAAGETTQGPQLTNSVPTAAPAAHSKTQSGPAGAAGTVTGPLANKEIQLEKLACNLLERYKISEINDTKQKNTSKKIDLSFRLGIDI